MAPNLTFFKALFVGGAVILSSCGGGGDVAGGLTAFSVSPEEVGYKALKGDVICQNTWGAETVVTIIGGTPPYRVVSSAPQSAIINKTEVTGKNPTFTVTTGPGCMEKVSVTILDYHSRTAVFSLTVEKGEELDS